MRLTWSILVVLWIEHGLCYDEEPYKCQDGTELRSTFLCDGIGQCPPHYNYADYYDEDYNVCVDPRNVHDELHLITARQENGIIHLSWRWGYERPRNSTEEKNRYFRDDVYLHRAGYFLTAKSTHHTMKKTLAAERRRYSMTCLRPWTRYDIILRPFYTQDGEINTAYKIGKAAFQIISTPPAAPSAPTSLELTSVVKGEISMLVYGPDDWNGKPAGYRVRWESEEAHTSKQGYEDIDFTEETSENAETTITVDLVAGRSYRLYVSARNQGYDNKTLVGPEIETNVVTVPLDPVEVTAQSIGPKEIDVAWRTEGYADLFLVAVCNGSCPAVSRSLFPFPPMPYYMNNPQPPWRMQEMSSESSDPNYVLVKVDGGSAESSVYSVLVERPALAANLSIDVVSCYKNVCSEAVTTTLFSHIRQPPTLEVAVVRPTWIEVLLLPSSPDLYELRCCDMNSICRIIYTKTSTTIYNLIPNTTYDVELRRALRDAKGHVTLGPAARDRITTWSVEPLSPTVKVAVPNEVGDTLVLSWNFVNSTVDYLQISVAGSGWRNCTIGASCTMSIIYGQTATGVEGFIKLSDLLLCTEYTISVRGCNVNGCGEGTTVTAWTSMGGPSTPTGLNVASEADGAVMVSWTEPGRPAGPLGGYMVSWKCPGAELLTTTTTKKWLTVRDLPNRGRDCKFSVVGFNVGPWDHQFVGDSAEFTFRPPETLDSGYSDYIID